MFGLLSGRPVAYDIPPWGPAVSSASAAPASLPVTRETDFFIVPCEPWLMFSLKEAVAVAVGVEVEVTSRGAKVMAL